MPDYPAAQMFVSYAYNQRKWLDSMVAMYTTPMPFPTMAPLFKQVLSYDPAGQITQQRYQHTNAPEQVQYYSYDSLQRLTNWGNGGGDTAQYDYDKVGNRLYNWTNSYLSTLSYNGAGPNQLSQNIHDDYMGNLSTTAYSYNADGAVTGITTSYQPFQQPSYDTLHYSWRGLTRGYTHQVGTNGELRDWRYRYSAGGEREQKRLYLGRDDNHQLLNDRAWVYYLLGANKAQLAVYHGQEHDLMGQCGIPGWNVYLYPVEYLSYGLGSSANVVTKGEFGAWTKEYRIADHLGSVRATQTLNGTLAEYDYEPFGKLLPSLAGGNDRTTFIDKEKDRESGLGDFGVRKYDEGMGRFLSVDLMIDGYPGLSPYQYAANNPLRVSDPTGFVLDFSGAQQVDGWNNTNYTEEIRKDLQAKSGLTLAIVNGQLEYDKDVNGNPLVSGGSSLFRSHLLNAINDKQTVNVTLAPDGGSMADGNDIRIDPNQVSGFMGGTSNGLNATTLGWGMTMMHELQHTTVGGGLLDPTGGFGKTGDVVDIMNKMRNELDASLAPGELPYG